MRYGIVIDLERCFGCNACTVICKQKNGTAPGVFWSRVYVSETGEYPKARREHLPSLCMHCMNPPCVKVCPTGASYRREDGIVLVDSDKCVGCRSCMSACPYDARTYHFGKPEGYTPEKGLTSYETALYATHAVGTVEKCTLCQDSVEQGLEPACVQTCPTKARIFGDLNDPNSKVSQLIATRGGQQLKPEARTNPSVYYLRG